MFFGRDRLIDRLMDLTRRHRFVAVFGPSGSGKSSLLRAGLIPRLQHTDDPVLRSTALRVLTPGAHPLSHDRRLTPKDADGDTWLIVDQFEELYTVCNDPADRDQFIDRLLTAADPAGRLRVVIAVRADFLGRCAEHPRLTAALQDATLLTGPMSREELREAIVQPARAAGLIVERPLTSRIVAEVEGEPGGLPLMSHALLETWRRRKGRTLSEAAYEGAGGLRGAIARTAEDCYSHFTPAQADLARRTLLRLITPGDGSPDTRRPIPRNELDLGDPADTTTVLEHLTRARLLTLDGESVDLAHEALIIAWPRLRAWIDAERHRLRVHRHLTDDAYAWNAVNRDPATFYRGSRLTIAEEAFPDADRHSELTALEQAFLLGSLELRHREQQAVTRATRRLRWLAGSLVAVVVLSLLSTIVALRQARIAGQQRAVATSRELSARADVASAEHPETAMMLALRGYRAARTTEARSSLLSAFGSYQANQLTGHTGNIEAVAFSPDGRALASASADHSVKVWNARTHQVLATLRGHADVVTGVTFSPDGHTLATVSADRSIKLWSTATYRTSATLTGHTNAVTAVAFSPDGQTLAASDTDGTVRLWSTATRRTTSALPTHSTAVHALSFSPDGRTLAIAADRKVLLWATTSPRTVATFSGYQDVVRALAFSPDGRTLAAGSDDSTLRLWSLRTHRTTAIRRYTDSVTGVLFSPDGQTVIVPSAGSVVQLWNTTTRRTDSITVGQDGPYPLRLALSPDGHTLAAGLSDGTVELWSTETHRLDATLGEFIGASRAAFSPDNRSVAIAFADGTVKVWDVTRKRYRITLNVHSKPMWSDSMWGVAFSPDGRTVAAGGAGHTVRIWNSTTGREVAVLTGQTSTVMSLSFSPDSRLLAAGQLDGKVRVWDVIERRTVTLAGHKDDVYWVAFSPDGQALATASADHTVKLWNISTGRPTATLAGHKDDVYSVAFSPDGQALATASADHTVKLWNISTGRPTATLTAHTDAVTGISFSPDGRTLISSSYDHTVRVWDARTRRTLTVLVDRRQKFKAMELSPDGRKLVTVATGENPGPRIWDLDADDIAKQICHINETQRWSKVCPE
ncbi:hypothetical protein G3I56_42385 [Streptomyces sp. SID12488]|nr:WD40 repeat domain-containing protein [Streptomyces sp. SID12488]NEA69035.1 hypothetical protein [Streptomyces sp. SID12488]